MKFDFTRMTVATSVTVALTCLGNVAWADCYQDGYNDGQKACPACPACPPLPNCQEGDYGKGYDDGLKEGNNPINCQKEFQNGYGDGYKSGFEAGKVEGKTEGEKAGKESVTLPNCKEGDFDAGKASVTVPNCTEDDYGEGFEAGKASVTVTPLNCQEGDYDRGLQEGKDSVNCTEGDYDRGLENGKQEGNREATLSYTGYVDTTTSTPTAKSCQENPNHEACKSPKGFTDGYDEGMKWATAQYTGYIDEAQTPSVPKSCSEADANDEECSSKQEGFKEGYQKGLATAKANEGEASGTEPNAHQSYTGYVDETGVAHSCQEVQENSKADPATKEAKCANRDGFEKGFTLGQLSLAGYVGTDEDGKKVPKSCQEDANNDACKQEALKGFTDGYDLGRQEVANSTTKLPSAESKTEQPLTGEDLTKCQKTPSECSNKVFTQGYEAGQKVAPDTSALLTEEELTKCQKTPSECSNKVFTQGYEAGQKAAPDTLAECKKNPQSCIINYLQGFYDYFVQRRLQGVTDNEKVFPASLTVQPFGGHDSNTPADQWKYTWRNNTQGCEAISGKKSKQFEPDGDHQAISLCIEQTKDMNAEMDPEKPGFGGSKDTSALTSEQSLGYTVYLLDPLEPDEKKKVKATMEIIFSPNEDTSTVEGNASESGEAGATTTEEKPVTGDGDPAEGDSTVTDKTPVSTPEKSTEEDTTATDEKSASASEENTEGGDTMGTDGKPVTTTEDKEGGSEKTLPELVETDTGATTTTNTATSDKKTP